VSQLTKFFVADVTCLHNIVQAEEALNTHTSFTVSLLIIDQAFTSCKVSLATVVVTLVTVAAALAIPADTFSNTKDV
jgi:hypothetical protein